MAWSAGQYLKFEDERTRPARDLLAQVPLESLTRGYDLGCGPGNSTALLVERFGKSAITGIDSDSNMLEAARARLPQTPFLEGDLSRWEAPAGADLFFANAVYQWMPDHLSLLAALMAALAPGGVLAVQMPDNLDEPSHIAMEETAAAGAWKARFANSATRRRPLPAPAVYYEALSPLASRVEIWHSIYQHVMPDADAIVEWVKGTGLRPYLDRAGPEHREAFLADYAARIAHAYPAMADGRRLLRFPRLFLVAVR